VVVGSADLTLSFWPLDNKSLLVASIDSGWRLFVADYQKSSCDGVEFDPTRKSADFVLGQKDSLHFGQFVARPPSGGSESTQNPVSVSVNGTLFVSDLATSSLI